MVERRIESDVLVIGGGPAGMAAAFGASKGGGRVAVVDENPGLGGQIWRGQESGPSIPEARDLIEQVQRAGVRIVRGTEVFAAPEPGLLLAEDLDGAVELNYRRLVIATGASERFLPFPGWTLPNVTGAGGLQALVKSGLPIAGKKVVVAGSGPLLLPVAAFLRAKGADVRLIAEQTPFSRLLRFGFGMLRFPTKIKQAVALRRELAGIPYLTNCRPVSAQGDGKVESLTLKRGNRVWNEPCDFVACGFHLVPNLELPLLLGCRTENGSVAVDGFQETSNSGIYCAGESTGIGGVELSLTEGRIAGLASVELENEATKFFSLREKQRRFAYLLNKTFSLGEELRSLPTPETLVCRCEDVAFSKLNECHSWRSAKLHTRCGMGPCQGRVCGPAVEFLFGWTRSSVRPPIYPVRLGNLCGGNLEDSSNS